MRCLGGQRTSSATPAALLRCACTSFATDGRPADLITPSRSLADTSCACSAIIGGAPPAAPIGRPQLTLKPSTAAGATVPPKGALPLGRASLSPEMPTLRVAAAAVAVAAGPQAPAAAAAAAAALAGRGVSPVFITPADQIVSLAAGLAEGRDPCPAAPASACLQPQGAVPLPVAGLHATPFWR